MSIRVKTPEGTLAEVAAIKTMADGRLRNVTVVRQWKDGKWRTIWERIDGFLFAKGGVALAGRGGVILKAKGQ